VFANDLNKMVVIGQIERIGTLTHRTPPGYFCMFQPGIRITRYEHVRDSGGEIQRYQGIACLRAQTESWFLFLCRVHARSQGDFTCPFSLNRSVIGNINLALAVL
jgi:hypothetical protein